MTTEEALDALVAELRRAFPDHRAADFPTAYWIVREWFRVPIDDRRDEVFQVVCGPMMPTHPKCGAFSFCRLLRREADGAYIQAWVTLRDRDGVPGGPDWSEHCWYGRDFADPDGPFAALEATTEYESAPAAPAWHAQVSWQRNGEPFDMAVILDDLRRAALN